MAAQIASTVTSSPHSSEAKRTSTAAAHLAASRDTVGYRRSLSAFDSRTAWAIRSVVINTSNNSSASSVALASR